MKSDSLVGSRSVKAEARLARPVDAARGPAIDFKEDDEVATEEADDRPLAERMNTWMTGVGAMGFYCSALIHFIAIGIAVLVLWCLDLLMLPVFLTETSAVRASLSDQEVEDLNAEMETFDAVSFEVPGGSTSSEISTPADLLENGEEDIKVAETSLTAGLGKGSGGTIGDENGFVFKLPKDGRAVTKGSFTAWTEPKSPPEGQPYQIIIEVRVPEDLKRYRTSDLRGSVTGTDKYTQKIPIDPKLKRGTMSSRNGDIFVVKKNMFLPIHKGKVQLIINVPPARALVRDTIEIESRSLKEKQSLELVFSERDSG